MVSLLVGEYLLLSLLFDAHALVVATGWASAIGSIGRAGPLLLVVPTAALLLQRDRLTAAWRAAAPTEARRGAGLAALAGHVAAFGAVVGATAQVLATPGDVAWIAAWLLTTSAWLGLAVLAVLPGRALGGFARAAAGPIAVGGIVGLAAWAAGLAGERLWMPMAGYTLRVSHALLALVAGDAVMDGDARLIGLGSFVVEVAPECSGFEGMGVVAVFLGGFLYACRRELRFPRALVVVPAAVAAAWLLNAVRIAGLVLFGDRVDADIALAGFHSKAGWLAVCVVALAGAAWARRSRWLARDPVEAAGDNPTAAYLVPLLALLASALTTGMVARGVDLLYGARIVAVGGALWMYRRDYADAVRGYRPSLAAVGFGVVAFALWWALEPAADAAAVTALRGDLAGAGWVGDAWIAARLVGSILAIPIAEELAFRGYALRRLVAADFTAVDPRRVALLAAVGSSLMFGLLHGRWLAGTLAGLVYAAAMYRRGQLADAVLAHAVTNALVAIWVLGLGRWEMWT